MTTPHERIHDLLDAGQATLTAQRQPRETTEALARILSSTPDEAVRITLIRQPAALSAARIIVECLRADEQLH